jgi:tetratricopeptide (TPR) repeat protein
MVGLSLGRSLAQGDEPTYKAYIAEKDYKTLWKKDVDKKTTILKKESTNRNDALDLAVAHLGLLSSTNRDRDENLFDEYYDHAVENLESMIEQDKKWAEPKALLSAVYGLKMGYSPMQGMFLGSKSASLIEKAKELAPQSPMVWKIYANSKYFTPEMWGGDLKEAIAAYEKSVQLYESKPADLKFNWMYLDALAFLGQAYFKNNEIGKAITTYEKILKLEPEFGWVKYSLLPKAKAKTN